MKLRTSLISVMHFPNTESNWAAMLRTPHSRDPGLGAVLFDMADDELFEPSYVLLLLSFELGPELL
jgi:hypothetical protein